MRNFAVMALISFLFVFASASFAAYQVYSDATVIAGQPFYVKGNVSGTFGYNISVNITGNNANNSFSYGGGSFDVNISAPSVVGEYNVTVMSVNDTSNNKTIRIYVTNISSNFSTITFTRNKPPFSAGLSFSINVSLKNTTGSFLHNYTPRMEIYSANGVRQTAWTIANMSNTTDHRGWIEYNITIPSAVDGDFVISADKGNLLSFIIVKSNYIMSVSAQTSSNETKFDYTPSSTFSIVAKIRDTSGNAIGNAINTTAKVTKADGTVETVTLANDTSVFGQYKGSYTLGSTTGQYTIKASGIVGTTTVEASTTVNVQQIKAIFDTQKEFFREWGDSSAFVPGGTVGLIVLATNLSDSSIFGGSTRTSPSGGTVNCTRLGDTLQVYYLNGTKYVVSGTITNDSSGTYFSQNVCRVQFTGPSETGNYKIIANVSIGTGTPSSIATGYFAIQRFVLKPTAVSSLGGSFDFMTMLHPGENATFDLGAYDLANNSEVAGLNITNITITKILPLEFNAGANDIVSGSAQRSDVFNLTNITAGTNLKNPSVTVGLPVNRTGPYLIEMQAIIDTEEGDQTITGRGFYISKYIMGFLSSSGRTDAAFGGPQGGFGGMSSCSEGTEKFSGNVRELKTNTAPKDPVSFNNILQAREELSGRDISSCITMSTNSSDSNGQVTVPMTFNRTKAGCESLSGFHFMLINVTYQGREDQIPAGFMCRQFQFWPQGKDSNNASVWRVDSKGSVNFTLDNTNTVRRLNDSKSIANGTVTIIRAFNFNPGTGMQVLTLNSSSNLTANLSNSVMSLVVTPSTFSRATYPNGFISITWKFTPNGSEATGSDTTETGFQVSAFDAYVMNTERPTTGGNCGAGVTCMTNGSAGGFGGYGSTFSAGQDIIIWLRASTNVSKTNNTNGGTNLTGGTLVGVQSTSGFTAKIGLPWEGKLKPVTINNATLVTDDWNGSYDNAYPRWGAELWRLNVTIPTTLKKGMQTLQIEVNSSANGNSSEKVSTDVWFSIVKYSVVIGQEEGMQFEGNFKKWGNYSSGTGGGGGGPYDNTTIYNAGWNLTYINETYNLRSKSDAVCFRNELNVTRWSQSSNAISYNRSLGMRVLVLDNATAGVYDTVIINATYPGVDNNRTFVNNITILRVDRLGNITTAPTRVTYNVTRNITSDLYLWQILDCSYLKWVNASYIPSNVGSWAGQYQKGTNFTIPYIIKRSSSTGPAISGATVSVNAVIKQNDASSTGGAATGGYGFSKKLVAPEYQSDAVVTGTTGLAFVPANISGSTGSFMIFWRVNETSGQEDIASFQSEGFGGFGGDSGGGDLGTQVQIRAFDTWSSRLPRVNASHATIPIKLRNITAPADGTITIYGVNLGGAAASTYNVTWNEAVGGQLSENSALDNFTILFNFSAAQYGQNATIMGKNTADLSSASVDTSFTYSIDSKSIAVGTVRNTDGQNLTIAFYEDSSSQAYYPIINTTQNISVRVCALTFTKPQKPILGANVYLYAESWGTSGFSSAPTTTPLRWHDPINGTPYLFGPVSGVSVPVANATVGPKGCVALDINNPLGWTAYTSYSIKAKVKRTSAADNETDTENTYVDYVWRSPQCSNGLDDDGDGARDYIGYGGGVSADTSCSSYSDDDESA